MANIKDEHKVILVTGIAILGVWFSDAAMDAFVFKEGPFWRMLTNVREREPFLRLVLSVGFMLFGFILSRIMAKHNRAVETLKKHSAAIEMSMDGIAIYNSEGEYAYVNPAYASINGYDSPDEVVGKSFRDVYDERELERMEQICLPALKKNGRWRGELNAKRKNGSTYFQEASVTMLDDGGRVCIVRDITWRKRSEERLRRSEQFLNTILNSIRDPFCIFDNEFRIIRSNESYAGLKNKTVDELIGKKCYEVLANRDTVCDGCVVEKTFQSTDPCAKDKLVVLQSGSDAWLDIYTYPILDDEGKVTHVMEYTRDITDRKKSEEERRRLISRLEYLSNTDGLTGLLNRRALTDALTYELDRARRYSSELAVILCDIDNFKPINDLHGHAAGDRALQIVSDALRSLLRKADIAGRYGGDEFMLILPETTLSGAESLAEKLRQSIVNMDLRIEGKATVNVSLSIGVAALDQSIVDIDALVKKADDAMYTSKQTGRNKVSSAS